MAEYIVDYTKSQMYIGFEEDHEPIVRCRDCEHRRPKGYRYDEFSNAAKQDSCALHTSHDFDYSYTEFFYVEPDDYCSRAKQRKEADE